MLNRILLIIATILLTTSSFASADGFEKIHKVNMSKDQIHNAVIEWIATTFNDPSSVIKVNDKAGGQVIVQPIVHVIFKPRFCEEICEFKTIINIKDGRYKILYTNFFIVGEFNNSRKDGSCPNLQYNVEAKDDLDIVLRKINNIDESLSVFVSQYKKKDNW